MASMDVDIAASILAASHRPPHSTLSSSLFAVRSSQVFAKPPKYVQVSSLKYIAGNRPKRNPHTDMCTCVSVENGGNGCDENCLNAMMFIEVRVGEEQRGAKRQAKRITASPEHFHGTPMSPITLLLYATSLIPPRYRF